MEWSGQKIGRVGVTEYNEVGAECEVVCIGHWAAILQHSTHLLRFRYWEYWACHTQIFYRHQNIQSNITWIRPLENNDLCWITSSEAEQYVAVFPSQFDFLKYGFALVVYFYTRSLHSNN